MQMSRVAPVASDSGEQTSLLGSVASGGNVRCCFENRLLAGVSSAMHPSQAIVWQITTAADAKPAAPDAPQDSKNSSISFTIVLNVKNAQGSSQGLLFAICLFPSDFLQITRAFAGIRPTRRLRC